MNRNRRNDCAKRGAEAARPILSANGQKQPSWDWRHFGLCLLLAALVFAVFGQTTHFDFVNYDDDENIYAVPAVVAGLSLQGVAWAFHHSQVGHWAPLTTLSRMMDCQVYHLWAGGHHLTNVLLHAAGSILLFLVIRQMTAAPWRSFVVAAIFAIHPLRVESVAWISERKDVLSGIFFFLTLWAYVWYTRQRPHAGRYLVILLCLAAGLMCKAMLVTTPFVLLLLDYWPLDRWRQVSRSRLLLEKVPFFALSAISCVAAIIAARQILAPMDQLPLFTRLENAVVAYVTYLGKTIYPSYLAVFYPLPSSGVKAWVVIVAALLLAVLTAGAFLLRRTKPYLLVGWLWYLGMLVPVIGIVQAGKLALADRYLYLPQIGLLLAVTWGVAAWAEGHRFPRMALASITGSVILLLGMTAYRQTTYWRDSETLWAHTLACTKDNDVAHNNLANVLLLKGKAQDAMSHYYEAVRINPNYAYAHNNLAHLLFRAGQREQAVTHYLEAVRCDPASPEIRISFGMDLFQLGQTAEATNQFQEALRTDPDCSKAHLCLGNVKLLTGRPDEAIPEYREALRLNSTDSLAQANLNRALGMIEAQKSSNKSPQLR